MDAEGQYPSYDDDEGEKILNDMLCFVAVTLDFVV